MFDESDESVLLGVVGDRMDDSHECDLTVSKLGGVPVSSS
jgi:hypothetical protein